jgi:hypothetical protein
MVVYLRRHCDGFTAWWAWGCRSSEVEEWWQDADAQAIRDRGLDHVSSCA